MERLLHRVAYFRALIWLILWSAFVVGCGGLNLKTGHSYDFTFTYTVHKGAGVLSEDDFREAAVVVERFIDAVRRRDVAAIEALLPADDVVYVDIKSPMQSREFARRVARKGDFLYGLYWDSYQLRVDSGSNEMTAFVDLFQVNRFKADLFENSADQIEAQLSFAGRPAAGMMGNLVLEKTEGGWLIRQLP